MKIGVLGTGMVGDAIGSKLVQLGHTVKMGARSADNEKASAWAQKNGALASHGTFAEAAAAGEVVFNCTAGAATIAALHLAGAENLKGKVLIDIAVPLDFSRGMPPTLTVCNTDSLGEQVQRALPETKVVKALNTVNCNVMVNPSLVPGDHDMFICGNDPEAKARVVTILKDGFGWQSVVDLGDISAARTTEMLLPLWVRLFGTFGSPLFNLKVVR